MSLLLDRDALLARRAVAVGPLATLATGLRTELAPLLTGAVEIPRDKALLSRTGGRCPNDGTLLLFDPLDPRHRCPRCGAIVVGELHDRFRPYWYQLWLAERVLHAALLGVLLDDAACVTTASRLLEAFARRYLEYPNRDNVLGPSRPFFSTYLESIWLLQLTIALDLLETGAPSAGVRTLGGVVRERLVEPSMVLIQSYDEGMSNRQAWNDAALIAAGVMLGRDDVVARATRGASGLVALLQTALLDDGSWYEGENYHLFAHRGLWYGVQMAACAGIAIPTDLVDRFDAGFASPFRTLLPDLTYPSRRDSQYAVSVRQPRFAESCELGLARRDDPPLFGMLARLYDPTVPRGDTGRFSSTADVERNLPATGLARADLSWRSLLFARSELPALVPIPLESDLLPAQGFGIIRREAGRVYVALDYGRSGGGHGHPDRLNVLLSDGATRWFDDPGTGSYVDESLHWYRSTLAHTAPLVDGRSQPRVNGELVAFADDADAGWIRARAELAPGCDVQRTIVVCEDYLIDHLEWEGAAPHEVALPLHAVRAISADGSPVPSTSAPIDGGREREDGFSYLRETASLALDRATVAHLIDARESAPTLRGWIFTTPRATYQAAMAPGAPGNPHESMILVRARAKRGSIIGVWSWRGAVQSAASHEALVTVTHPSGRVDTHRAHDHGWSLTRSLDTDTTTIELGGVVPRTSQPTTQLELTARPDLPAHALPARFILGASHYRRSEQSWEEVGRPEATIVVAREGAELVITVDVPRSERNFVDVNAENPYDNEPAAINGDGVQLYLATASTRGAWLLVPVASSETVGVRDIEGWGGELAVHSTWRQSADGYTLTARVSLSESVRVASLDVLVNETPRRRVRRRGQLILSGSHEEFVYLRGDRHEADRLLRFTVDQG